MIVEVRKTVLNGGYKRRLLKTEWMLDPLQKLPLTLKVRCHHLQPVV